MNENKLSLEDVLGASLVSSKMRNAMTLWEKMYRDEPPWKKEATLDDPTEIVTIGLPALIASEKARMATLEMKSTVTSASSSENAIESEYIKFLNDNYQEKVVSKIREKLEYSAMIGGLIIKPYVVINGDYKTVEFDFILQNNFIPIAFDASGKIVDAAFLQTKTTAKRIYTRLERHTKQGNSVVVKNTAYVKNIDMQTNINITYLGQQIPLSSVPEWESLEPETVFNGVDRLLFAYLKIPDANNIDLYSPLGVSVYSRACELIKQADVQFSRLLWEFKGGELAIDVDRNALIDNSYKDDDGNIHNRTSLGIMQQRLFRKTSVDTSIGETYNVFSPALRDTSILNGLNSILMKIEDATALSRGTLSDVNLTERTATELKINKQRTYQSNSEIQKALENALKDVIYSISAYVEYYDMFPIEDYAVSFSWDDSIINDVQEELNTRLILTQNGIESKINLRMWYFGETEEQARAALAKIAEEDEGIKIEEE